MSFDEPELDLSGHSSGLAAATGGHLRGLLQRTGSGLSSVGSATTGRRSPSISFASPGSPAQPRTGSILQNPTTNTTSNSNNTSNTNNTSTSTPATTATAANPLGKNMTLFAQSDLNLPAFGNDYGTDSTGKPLTTKNNPRSSSPLRTTSSSSTRNPPEYSIAPNEFMNEFFSATNTTTTSSPSRRRSTDATTTASLRSAMSAKANPDGSTIDSLQLQDQDNKDSTGIQGIDTTLNDEDDEDLTPIEVNALDILDQIDSNMSAQKVSDILLSVHSKALESAYVLSHITKKLSLFSLDKYAEAHFQYDRRATNSSNTMHTHPIEKLLTYQAELIKTPLTALPTVAASTDAVACFRLICAFMENGKSTGLAQIDLAMNLLLKLLTASSDFHDEIYCQLCKQSRKAPTPEALEFVWQLMLLCLATIPPSRRLLPYLITYISSALHRLEQQSAHNKALLTSTNTTTTSNTTTSTTITDNNNAMKFVLLALRTVIPAATAAVRSEIPTRTEIRALLLGENIDISVNTMIQNSLPLNLLVNSFTTVDNLLIMICDALQLQDENRRIFALYEVSNTDDTNVHNHTHTNSSSGSSSIGSTEVELSRQERVLDWVSRCHRAQLYTGSSSSGGSSNNEGFPESLLGGISQDDREHFQATGRSNTGHYPTSQYNKQSYKLLFKAKYLFQLSDHCIDIICMNLLYSQCLYDVLNARYLHTAADAIVLAAYVLQDLCGDYHPGTRTLAELKIKSLTLSKLISRSILELNNINKYELEMKIFTAYKTLTGMNKETIHKLYLSYISCWKVFGATFFIVTGQVSSYTTEIVLSVSVKSILLLDPISKQHLAEYKYSDIYSWGHSFDSFVLIIGSKSSQSKSYFKTSQGKEIDSLVKMYHDYYVRCSSSDGSSSGGGSNSSEKSTLYYKHTGSSSSVHPFTSANSSNGIGGRSSSNNTSNNSSSKRRTSTVSFSSQ